ncbi:MULTISPECIES: pentapeptide repeat-containing protein [unclassified Methylophilus]|uniref:pentapeptide repeat-containing protein n=1 Tax=unclassified Methylophilus TaxID=2630143 RepID=UPI0006FC34C0|nr:MULTISPECIES: pentapeptide repeat-containing protein [unclassified Methylophilus]KQT41703.1 hypothetical protein ASG34_09005 [Methylophilus sp. Leaf416]KQT55870.1 hypothetical protein ASG44_10535 [Methylophilus sp. Leaf459]
MNEINISIAKPIPTLKKSIKIDFKGFGIAIAKTGIALVTSKFDSASENGLEVLSTLGLKTEAEEVAWLLIFRSLIRTIKSLWSEKIGLGKDFPIESLIEFVNVSLESHTLQINKVFFDKPDKDPIVNIIKKSFVDWLLQLEVDSPSANAIADRLPSYFANALNEEWVNHQQTYNLLINKLNTPFTQANARAQGWSNYSSWLCKQIDQPLFLEVFSLNQVYVPLRAFYLSKQIQKNNDSDFDINSSEKNVRHVVDLETEINLWIQKSDKDDAIRLISGGPGSGKSSFAKVLAASLARAGKIPTLFISLHHLNHDNDLLDAIEKFVQQDGFLTVNPILGDQKEDRIIIIFDGLDELSMQGKVGERVAQDFVREVQRKTDRLNQQKLTAQVIITGRELVIQANESSFRKIGQILHVLPYWTPTHEQENYSDPNNFLELDQRNEWWRKYGNATGVSYYGLPIELDIDDLVEITTQPLLNYLVALSLKRGILDFSKNLNLNAIYADLLKAIYERAWASNPYAALDGIEEKDFVRILEEIALSSWHGNGRTTTVKEIESHCKNSGLSSLLAKFQAGMETDTKAKVTQLLTAFYFRQNGKDFGGEKTFEFTHKSFGEFLTAKRIVREIRLINKKLEEHDLDPDEGWDEREALHKWIITCGATALDSYIFNFIINEIEQLFLATPLMIKNWQSNLSRLLSSIFKHGTPLERLTPRPTFEQEINISRNAEEGLLVVLNACARATKENSKLRFPTETTFSTWLSTVCRQRPTWEKLFALDALSYLDLEGLNLIGKDLWNANLYKANLSNSNLVSADCRYANFEDSICEKTNFVYSILSGTHFINSNLSYARFENSFLESVRFDNATLIGANFLCATLGNVSFKGANLAGADFRRAYIAKVNFDGANLEGALFTGAVLNNCDIPTLDYVKEGITKVDFCLSHFLPANQRYAFSEKEEIDEEDSDGEENS